MNRAGIVVGNHSPFCPAYATTMCKAQGQTLDKAVVWFDIDNIPPATAYVALSRVRSRDDIYFMRRLQPCFSTPDDPPSNDTIFRRLSSINCEWLRRPRTGISEFA